LVDTAPDGDQWLHEIKYDGYRMHAPVDRGSVKLLTRTGLDWTHKYPAITKAVAKLDDWPGPSVCGSSLSSLHPIARHPPRAG
jgi:ATP-dependent DNA ligase